MHQRTFFSIPHLSGSFKSAARVIKLTALILLLGAFSSDAKTKSQSITFSVTNASLTKIFEEIKRQSEYTVFYNYDILPDAKRVSVNVKEASVEQVLNLALKNQPLTYVIEDRMIAIYRKEGEKVQVIANTPPPPINISGRVTNEKDEPVAGASVVI